MSVFLTEGEKTPKTESSKGKFIKAPPYLGGKRGAKKLESRDVKVCPALSVEREWMYWD